MKKYTISILTYKAFPLCKACVDSVIKHSPKETYNLILTNNGGGSEVANYFESIRAIYPDDVTVVHNQDNLGFIIPNNQAFAATTTKYFVMLNDDAQVPDGWLEALEKPFIDYPKAALSGLSGGCQTLTEEFHGRLGGAFEYLEGSCLMVSVPIVKPHGLFSDYLEFAYGEDSDLSLRMRKLGYTLHKVDMHLVHHRAQTARHIPNIKAIQNKNHMVLRQKWSHYLRVRRFEYPIVVRRWAARGDAFLAAAIVKKLKEENPLSDVFVETAFPEFFQQMPFVKKADQKIDRPWDCLYINLDMAYEMRNHLSILDAYADVAGVKRGNYDTGVYPTKADEDWYYDFLEPKIRDQKTIITVHAGPTTWQGKNWPVEKWTQLLTKFQQELKAFVILVGHGEATPLPCDLDLRGGADWCKSAIAIRFSSAFVGLDSFPIHMAQAVRTPVVGLFGVTDPKLILLEKETTVALVGDQGAPDRFARHTRPGQTVVHSNGECIRSIEVETVFKATKERIKVGRKEEE